MSSELDEILKAYKRHPYGTAKQRLIAWRDKAIAEKLEHIRDNSLVEGRKILVNKTSLTKEIMRLTASGDPHGR